MKHSLTGQLKPLGSLTFVHLHCEIIGQSQDGRHIYHGCYSLLLYLYGHNILSWRAGFKLSKCRCWFMINICKHWAIKQKSNTGPVRLTEILTNLFEAQN